MVVVAFVVMLSIFGGVMVNSIVKNDPILTQASIQRYAYRALASGLNAYQNAINANPYLAACNSSANYSVGPPATGSPQCAGLNYQTWSVVPGTDVGNGVIPEYYKFDNPVSVKDATSAIKYLEVQIVGAAGFPGKNVFYSTVARFTPQNGFLNGVWWSNYESSEFPTGTATDCDYFYNQGRNLNGNQVGGTPCNAVSFISGDNLFGPVYSNDSLYISGSPVFSGTVNTADPNCLFVNDGIGADDKPACSGLDAGNYTAAGSGFGHVKEPLPVDNSQLAAIAKQGGCYYVGPTTVTLSVVGGVGKMTVTSADTISIAGVDQMNLPVVNPNSCPTNGIGNLPQNGVVYVDQGPALAYNALTNPNGYRAGANPFDSTANPYASQIQTNCPNCYYGASGTADNEADAFVSGSLSGHLTIAANNNVIIDGKLTYNDCTWAGTASQSLCNYNSALTGTNDTLGLIANNYVEVNRPLDNTTLGFFSGPPQTLPACGTGGALPAPLCDPSTATGSAGAQGLTIDATLLGLKQSFVVNNYDAQGREGQLTVYGSIQQNARGPVGTFGGSGTGYLKYYLWDPRLTLYGPPYYLTPGTASWALDSSAETYTGKEPSCPPPQATPSPLPAPTFPIAGSTAAGTGSCTAAS